MKIITVLILFSGYILLSCHSGRATIKDSENIASSAMEREIIYTSGPKAIVYKTTGDYLNLVPVSMDKGKTKIISYPAPSDVYYNGILAGPVILKNGYLLDNRGINENTVFLNYTYEEYSKLDKAPSLNDMMSRIENKYPLSELIDCGLRSRFINETTELNALIDAGFPDCKHILSTPKLLNK